MRAVGGIPWMPKSGICQWNAGLLGLKTICKRLYPGQGFYVEVIVGRDNGDHRK